MMRIGKLSLGISSAVVSLIVCIFLYRQQSAAETSQEHTLMNSTEQKPTEAELRERLSPLQYRVTQQDGTEPAFRNEFWDNKKDGLYVDIVSGEPLFSSTHKFDSGTGWPSFTQPITTEAVTEHTDRKLWMVRTEVRSKQADSHLGHVFSDGPKPTGQRYCINSAALRFVPKEKLQEEGYGDYAKLFEKDTSL